MEKSESLFFSVIFCLFLVSSLNAVNDIPVHIVNDEYVTEWLVLGPLFPDSLEKDFLAAGGGELNIEPKEGESIITIEGDTLRWKHFRSKQQIVDFLKAIGNYQNATAYAYCTIYSDPGGRKQFLIGSDDGVAVWINGEKVHQHNTSRQIFIDNDKCEVTLKKGVNHCLVKITQGSGKWGFAMRVLSENHIESVAPSYFVTLEGPSDQISLSSLSWKYQPGDNPQWAKPEYEDRDWELAYPGLRPNALPKSGWQNTGWFRLHITVDSILINEPLGLYIRQAGHSDIYLDGNLIYTFGEHINEWIGIPKVITFDEKKRHVIAVRFTNTSVQKYHKTMFSAGFYLHLGNLNRMTDNTIKRERTFLGFQVFFTTFPLAIALLHLFLFSFFPALRQNLIFALFLIAYAATIFYDYDILLSKDLESHLASLRMHIAMIPFWLSFQLMFVYSLFYEKLPKLFWIIVPIIFFVGVLGFIKPIPYFDKFGILYGLIYVEISRVIGLALYKKQEGTWIITSAFLVFFVFGIMDALMDMGILTGLRKIENPYAFGSIAFFVAMSIYLSRDFARANKKIVEQEMEQKLLEAENKRQAKELEEARQLQLSMLPKELPRDPGYDIAVFMKTATEVGGDYYDFKQHEDGTLTIVVGDATGHGMRAGTMVSATKSLFLALADEPEPVQFLKSGSAALKAMGLKMMYMALTIAKLKDRHMRFSSAGMPYPLVYRASSEEVEEVPLKGMPLGGFDNFPYEEKEVSLQAGDTVLFMSDGFEEMFNPDDEQIGAEQVKQIFCETAGKSPQHIINHLKRAAETWADGRDQEDDVTFVVIKIK
jgi:serine phosphatase RsbU (regulator of sigma subunit)